MNFEGLLILGYFPKVSTTILHSPRLVESAFAEELKIQRADYKLYVN